MTQKTTAIKPYVYKCTNKITKEFYFGYRKANKEPALLDFPKYKTSSKLVKHNFDNFNWVILAEFYNATDAYDFEQTLIYENWGDPLLLNGHYNTKTGSKFSGVEKHSESAKKKMSEKASKRKYSKETIEKRAAKLRGRVSPIKGKHTQNEHSKKKIGNASKIRQALMSQEEKSEIAKRTRSSPESWTDERKLKISQNTTGKKKTKTPKLIAALEARKNITQEQKLKCGEKNKGKTWILVNGKRVWVNKGDIS